MSDKQTCARFDAADDSYGSITVSINTPVSSYTKNNQEVREIGEEYLAVRCDYMDIDEEETIAFKKEDIPRLIAFLQAQIED